MTVSRPPLDAIVLAGGRGARPAPGPAILWLVLFTPLWLRLRRWEGQILLVAVALAVVQQPDLDIAWVAGTTSVLTLLLATLYAFNDLSDRQRDAVDPSKDHAFAAYLERHHRFAVMILVATKIGVLVAGHYWFGPSGSVAIAVAYLVNTSYSLYWKGTPGLDLLAAGVWGAAIAAVAAPSDPRVLAAIGVMTVVCHLFQVRRDCSADRYNGVRTTAVARPRVAMVAMVVASVSLGVLTAEITFPWLGLTALIPLGLYRSPLDNQWAWILAKLWFGVVFLLILDGLQRTG